MPKPARASREKATIRPPRPTDEASAKKFYSLVLGWETEPFPGGDVKYTLWKNHGKNVGGLMKRPSEDIAPHWLGYVTVADVDATARKAGQAGGKVLSISELVKKYPKGTQVKLIG